MTRPKTKGGHPLNLTLYTISSKTKKESRIVAQWNRGIIHPGDTDLWTGMTMKVPSGGSLLKLVLFLF